MKSQQALKHHCRWTHSRCSTTRSHAESLSELVLRIQRREVAVDGVHEAGGVLHPARDLAGGHVCLWLHRDGQESLCDVAPRIQVPVRSPSPQRR